MSVWKFLRQTLYISFIGFSLFSATFVISLLTGRAADHPILGSLHELFGYVQGIVACSFGMSVANVLSQLSMKRLPKQETYGVRSRSYSVIR
jgi:hypothetical protein